MSQPENFTKSAQYSLTKPIILVGFMGAGKTAIGQVLAAMLGAPFVDSDDEIVKAANMSIAEIFARDGEDFFRQKEHQILERLVTNNTTVLSTGGGAFISEKNQKLLCDTGFVIWLNADMELTWARVKDNPKRPLLQVENAYEEMVKLYEKRQPSYSAAHAKWQSMAGESKEAAAKRLLALISSDTRAGLKKEA